MLSVQQIQLELLRHSPNLKNVCEQIIHDLVDNSDLWDSMIVDGSKTESELLLMIEKDEWDSDYLAIKTRNKSQLIEIVETWNPSMYEVMSHDGVIDVDSDIIRVWF